MFRHKEKLMTNEEKIELINLTERVYGPHSHAVLDMRSSIHRRLSELQRMAQNELSEGEMSLLEKHLEYA
jgi:hypothetical protein